MSERRDALKVLAILFLGSVLSAVGVVCEREYEKRHPVKQKAARTK